MTLKQLALPLVLHLYNQAQETNYRVIQHYTSCIYSTPNVESLGVLPAISLLCFSHSEFFFYTVLNSWKRSWVDADNFRIMIGFVRTFTKHAWVEIQKNTEFSLYTNYLKRSGELIVIFIYRNLFLAESQSGGNMCRWFLHIHIQETNRPKCVINYDGNGKLLPCNWGQQYRKQKDLFITENLIKWARVLHCCETLPLPVHPTIWPHLGEVLECTWFFLFLSRVFMFYFSLCTLWPSLCWL